MGKKHTKQQRQHYAQLASSTDLQTVASQADVTTHSVRRWMNEFDITRHAVGVGIPTEIDVAVDFDIYDEMSSTTQDDTHKEELRFLQYAISDLAAHCDGALSRDDVGFGITTVVPGHHLASSIGRWEDEDTEAARIVCTIHKDQIYGRTGLELPKQTIKSLKDRAKLNKQLRAVSDKPLLRVENGHLLVTGCAMNKDHFVYDKSLRAWKIPLSQLNDAKIVHEMTERIAKSEYDALITESVPEEVHIKAQEHRNWVLATESRKKAKAVIFDVGVALDDNFPGYALAREHIQAGYSGSISYSHVPTEYQQRYDAGYIWWFEKVDSDTTETSPEQVIDNIKDNYLYDWVRAGLYVDKPRVEVNHEDNIRLVAFAATPSFAWRSSQRYGLIEDEAIDCGSAEIGHFFAEVSGYCFNGSEDEHTVSDSVILELHAEHQIRDRQRQEHKREKAEELKLHQAVIRRHWVDADSLAPIHVTKFENLWGSDEFEVSMNEAPFGELILRVEYSTADGGSVIKKVPVLHTKERYPRKILGKPLDPKEIPQDIEAAHIRQQPDEAHNKRMEHERKQREYADAEELRQTEKRHRKAEQQKAQLQQLAEQWGTQIENVPLADYVITRDGDWLAEVPQGVKVFVVKNQYGEKVVVTPKSRVFQSKFGKLKGRSVAFVRHADPDRD